MLYFGWVIVIYVYFNDNIKQLNEFFIKKFKKLQNKVKNLELTTKKEFSMIFKGLCITPKNHERNCVLNDYMQNIYFDFEI